MTEVTKSTVSLHSDRPSAETVGVKFPLPSDYFSYLNLNIQQEEAYRAEAADRLRQGRLTRLSFNQRQKEWKYIKRIHDVDLYHDISQPHNSTCVVVAIGTIQGKMEDLVHAEYTETSADFRRKSSFVDPKVVRDCHLLHSLDTYDRTKQPDGTFHFLGLKYIYTRVPVSAMGRLMKSRDYTFSESLGITTIPEPVSSDMRTKSHSSALGYHIMHTCEIPGVREFPNVVRGGFSVTNFYQQVTPGVVRMYSRGVIDPASDSMNEKFLVLHCINLVTRAFKIMQLAECQKLTRLVNDVKEMSTIQSRSASMEETNVTTPHHCSLCPRRVNYHILGLFVKAKPCDICNLLVCSKCRVKKVVINEKKNSIRCCQRCLLHSKEVIPLSASGSEGGRSSLCSNHSSGTLSGTMIPIRSSSDRHSSSLSTALDQSSNSIAPQSNDITESVGGSSPIVLHKLDEEDAVAHENMAGLIDVDGEFSSSRRKASLSNRNVRSSNSAKFNEPWGKSSSATFEGPRISHHDQLYQQMLALQRAAEIAYNTTQANRNLTGALHP